MVTNIANKQILKRGCGFPIAGGTYIEVPTGMNGTPIWQFVIDPTVPVADLGFPMSAIGMVLQSRGQLNANGQEIFDLYDWIGGEAYPNPLDWLFEVQQLGFHQKVNPKLLQRLVPESCYFAVHSRAGFEDPTVAYDERLVHPSYPKCPAGHAGHQQYDVGDKTHLGTCVGLFLSNVIKGSEPDANRVTVREMPSFSWDGFSPTGAEGKNIPSIFFKLNIGRMASFLVYEDTHGNAHEAALKALEKLDEKLQRVKLVSLDGGHNE